jgi:hypothetical protein
VPGTVIHPAAHAPVQLWHCCYIVFLLRNVARDSVNVCLSTVLLRGSSHCRFFLDSVVFHSYRVPRWPRPATPQHVMSRRTPPRRSPIRTVRWPARSRRVQMTSLPLIDGGSVGIPRDSGDAVEAFGHGSSILVSLPADDTSATRIGGTVVYDGPTDASDLAVQATPDGIRALVSINDSSAVRSYEFPISGDVARIDQRSDGASRSSTRGAAGLAVSMRHGHRTQTGIRCLRISTLWAPRWFRSSISHLRRPSP